MKRTRLWGICIALLLFLQSPLVVFAHEDPSSLLIINQVRGEECCEVGSVEHVQLQFKKLEELNLPATFALRYDALRDAHYTDLFRENQLHEVGLFLEITPQLAADAQVPYKGPIERWYKAQNAYLLGYTPEERQKIIDTLFAQFKTTFGKYPKTTVGWMVDSFSLRYMVEKYGVTLHEITREQWGTDSYTLSGGPVNSPYFPSNNWPLIPGQTKENSLPVVMVRQTITDPLFNYGDTSSSFTSQPNDYLRGKRDLNYFNHLLENATERQLPNGFGVIGLENSMAGEYQSEFLKQLEKVKTSEHEGKADIITAEHFSAHKLMDYPTNTPNIYFDQQEDKAAYWISTSHYRARVILKGNQLFISDLRLYSPEIDDPYATEKTPVANAYWVSPFIFDSSRYYTLPKEDLTDKAIKQIENIKKFFAKEELAKSELEEIQSDFDVEPIGIVFPSTAMKHAMMIENSPDSISLHYLDQNQKPVVIEFTPTKIKINSSDPHSVQVNESDTTKKLKELGITIEKEQQDHIVVLKPKFQLTKPFSQLVREHTDHFAPELNQDPPAREKSEVIFSNTHAIAGRNPIRIVLRLKSNKGHTTLVKEQPKVTLKEGTVDDIKVQQPEGSRGEYYIDLIDDEEKTIKPIVILDNQEWELQNVHFVANCKDEKWKCVNKPISLARFIWTKVQDVLNKR